MTLVEVIVSLLVFALASAGIVSMLALSLKTTRVDRQRVAAAQLAAQSINTLRSAVSHGVSIPVGQATSSSQTYQGTVYQLTTTAEWTSLGEQGDACSGGLAGTVAYQRIHVQVTWPTMGSTKPIVTDAVVTPPAGALTPNAINIPVRVIDGSSQPVSGLAVTVTLSGVTTSGVTDSNGCVLFAQLPPGVYTLGLNVAGYVDKDGVQNHTQTVGQTTAGTVNLTTVFYDRPATLVLSPQATFPVPTSYSMQVSQTSWQVNPGSFVGNGVSPVSVSVFPFTAATGSAYTAWSGNCSDNSQNSPSGFAAASTTSTLLVPFGNVQGSFTYNPSSSYVAAPTATITATSTAACGTSYTWSATTDASGQMNFSLPYGSYKFKIKVGSTTYSNTTTTYSVTPSTSALAVQAP